MSQFPDASGTNRRKQSTPPSVARRGRYANELPLFDCKMPKIQRKKLKDILAQRTLPEVMTSWKKKCAEKKKAKASTGTK